MRLVVLLAAVLLPGIVLAPIWSLAGLGAGEDDVLYYYPSRVFFHEMIQAGHWPWLNPWTGLGRPFSADPQSAVWYPFTWLFGWLPTLWVYPASLWVHYSLGLWGMYRLLRSLALGRRAAFFGGLAFAFCGFLLAHRAHFTMQAAAAWTPWVFWRMRRYAENGGTTRLLFAAVVAALQCFAGHVQIAAITATGSLVYLSCAIGANRRVAGRWLMGWLCAAGLFAVQWLPTYTYLRECTRADPDFTRFIENSWHPVSAIGWVLPMLFGQRTPNFFSQLYWGPSHQVEQFVYAGILPLLLAALALRGGWRRDGYRRGWAALAVFALLLALGEFVPLYRIVYWVPGASLFRVPARAMLLFNLALAALAAGVVHDLTAAHTPTRVRLRATALRWTRRPLLAALALVGIPLIAVVVSLPLMSPEARQNALSALRPWATSIWIPLLVAVVSLALLAFVLRRWQKPRLLWLLVLVITVDLGVIGWTIDVPARQGDLSALLAPAERTAWLEHVRGSPQRLWVVTARKDAKTPGEYVDSLRKGVANTNVLVQVASLVDYGPLQPRRLVQRFGFAPWGETERAAELFADTSWMRWFNVGWILLCEPHWSAPAGCELTTTTPDGLRLYRNPTAPGPAFFADPTQPGAVHYTEQAPYRFVTRVDTWPASPDGPPVRLIVSKLALPGWRASINGRSIAPQAAEGLLLAIDVPPGEALEIEWTYTPPGLLAGAIISGLSALALALFVLLDRRAGRRLGQAHS